MDGMGGQDEKLYRALNPNEQQKDYPCVWWEEIICPIRTKWKLSPENLTSWCGICKDIGYLDEQKDQIKLKAQVKTNLVAEKTNQTE